MKPLTCLREHRDIWLAPVGMLTPIRTVPRYQPENLPDDLARNGMRNPIVCWPMTWGDWARWCHEHPDAREVTPRPVCGATFVPATQGMPNEGAHVLSRIGLLWCIHVGNQRHRYAVENGYTHIAAALCDSHQQAVKWTKGVCR